MADYLFISSVESAVVTDDFYNVGAQTARNTTSPLRGSADLKATYPAGADQTFACQVTFKLLSGITFRKQAVALVFKYSATPTADVCLVQFCNKKIYISTNNKIKIDTTESSMAAMTPGTTYRLELIGEYDSGGPVATGVTARVDGGTTVNVNGLTAHGALVMSLFDSLSKVVGPNLTIQVDDIVWWASTTTTKYAPWLNSQTCQTIRRPIANGYYNSFTGIGDTTNKYLNVDDTTSDGATTLNNGGEVGVTENQTFTTTNVASYANTLRGFCFKMVSGLSKGQDTTGWYKTMVRDNSVDYTAGDSYANLSVGNYNAGDWIGYAGRPDGSALDATVLNAMEGGYQTTITVSSINAGYTSAEFNCTSDGATYDGAFTQTGGTAGSAYTCVNEGTSNDPTDYISSAAAGNKQGFGFTFNISPLTNIGDTIYKLTLYSQPRTNAAAGTAATFKVGCRIGGVDYDCDTAKTAALLTSGFDEVNDQEYMKWSGSFNNPATGLRWLKSDIEGAEWYLKHQTDGSGPLEFSKFWMGVHTMSNIVNTMAYMEVITGDAFTDNGNVPSGFLPRRNLLGAG